MVSTMTWQGLDEYKRKLKSLAVKKSRFTSEYLDIIGKITLKAIEQAAPKDTGAYSKSWSIVQRGNNFIIIDTSMPELFIYLENGTSTTPAQPHMKFVMDFLDDVISDTMRAQIAKHHKLFNHIPHRSNLTKTVGLTGTKVSSLRGRGKISMVRARTGRKQFKRRLGRRRRTGQWIKRAELS